MSEGKGRQNWGVSSSPNQNTVDNELKIDNGAIERLIGWIKAGTGKGGWGFRLQGNTYFEFFNVALRCF